MASSVVTNRNLWRWYIFVFRASNHSFSKINLFTLTISATIASERPLICSYSFWASRYSLSSLQKNYMSNVDKLFSFILYYYITLHLTGEFTELFRIFEIYQSRLWLLVCTPNQFVPQRTIRQRTFTCTVNWVHVWLSISRFANSVTRAVTHSFLCSNSWSIAAVSWSLWDFNCRNKYALTRKSYKNQPFLSF